MPGNKPVMPLEWAAVSDLCCVRVHRRTVASCQLPSAPGSRLCSSQSPIRVTVKAPRTDWPERAAVCTTHGLLS